MAELLELEPEEGELQELEPAEIREGTDWSKPIQEQHPGLSTMGRVGLKLAADAGPETMRATLEKMGFEAQHRGAMRFSIRKPGEEEWRVVDPKGWTDIPLDVLDVILPWGLTGAGMVAGGAAGLPAGPAGLAAGAALGAGGAEAAKQTVAAMTGVPVQPGEAGRKVALEAAAGGLAEVGGRYVIPRLASKVAGIKTGRKLLEEMPREQLVSMARRRGISPVSDVTEMDVVQLLRANKPIWQESGRRTKELRVAESAVGKARSRVVEETAAVRKANFELDRTRNLAARVRSRKEKERLLSAVPRLRDKLSRAKDQAAKARALQREAMERLGRIPEPAGPATEREFIEQLMGRPATMKQLTEAAIRDPDVALRLGVPDKAREQLTEELLRERAILGRIGVGLQKPAEITERVFRAAGREVGLPAWAIRPTLLGGGLVTAPVAGAALIASKYIGVGLKKVSDALVKDTSGAILTRLAARAKPEIAVKLSKPLEALKRSENAYKAAIFTMLHDPDVREFLEKKS